jgi:hypothetical protein
VHQDSGLRGLGLLPFTISYLSLHLTYYNTYSPRYSSLHFPPTLLILKWRGESRYYICMYIHPYIHPYIHTTANIVRVKWTEICSVSRSERESKVKVSISYVTTHNANDHDLVLNSSSSILGESEPLVCVSSVGTGTDRIVPVSSHPLRPLFKDYKYLAWMKNKHENKSYP